MIEFELIAKMKVFVLWIKLIDFWSCFLSGPLEIDFK